MHKQIRQNDKPKSCCLFVSPCFLVIYLLNMRQKI